jgi:hypothetical protein
MEGWLGDGGPDDGETFYARVTTVGPKSMHETVQSTLLPNSRRSASALPVAKRGGSANFGTRRSIGGAQAPRCRPSRAYAARRQSPLCRHLAAPHHDARTLHEDLQCAGGEAENRFIELFEQWPDRTSSAAMAANQLRLWFAAIALHPGQCNALPRATRHPVCRWRGCNDSPQATQAWRLGMDQHAPFQSTTASSCPNQHEFETAYLTLKRTFSSA